MSQTPLELDERRDAWMFGGFVVLCLTIVAVVAIAQRRWDVNQWTAVGALGTWVQGIGVVLGLA